MATFIGTVYDDTYYGSAAKQYGIDGDDTLSPKSDSKAYTLYGGNGDDTLIGYSYNDEIYGGAQDDFLQGYGGDDYLEGGSGNDRLYGQYGNDELSGGRGQDSFYFDSKLDAKKNFDTITDFVHGSGGDLMVLDKTIFAGVGNPDTFLQSKKFEIGSEATSSKTRILYNQNKGVVYYDPDGSGSKSATKFVHVDKYMTLSHDDFYIVSG